MSLLIDLVTV